MAHAHPDPGAFRAIVWQIVRQIPRGQVATYGQIASMIPAPTGIDAEVYARLAPRWVGEAMNAVSSIDAPDVPWHRVINGQGGISLPPGIPAALQQRSRLQAEGIRFDARERVDLSLYGWAGPDEAWLEANNLLTPKPLRKPPGGDGGQLPLF